MNDITEDKSNVKFTNRNFYTLDRSILLKEASRVSYINVINLLINLSYKKIEIQKRVLKAAADN